jgi:hypothetical protein
MACYVGLGWRTAIVPEREVIAAILRPQTSPDTVKRMMELLYAAREYYPADKLDALANNPYPARFGTVTVEQALQDGETFTQTVPYTGQIYCGHNPFLYGRLVDNLRPEDPQSPITGLTWDERQHRQAIRL